MCNNKHLTLDDRLIIERELFFNSSFKKIAKLVNKDCTTISKEIRNHIMYRNSGAVGRQFFDCVNRYDCPHKIKGVKCNIKTCSHYKKEICPILPSPAYLFISKKLSLTLTHSSLFTSSINSTSFFNIP